MTQILNRRVYPAGTDLFRQGAAANDALIIQSGIVEMLGKADRNGKQEVFETCQQGEIVDLSAVLADKQVRRASARAVTPVVAISVSRSQVADRMSRTDPLIRTLFNLMADKLERPEMRRHKRTEVNDRATYITEDGISIDCEIADISMGGVKLKPALPVRRGDRAMLNFRDIDRICAVVVEVGKGWTRLRFDLNETRKRRVGEVVSDLPGKKVVPALAEVGSNRARLREAV